MISPRVMSLTQAVLNCMLLSCAIVSSDCLAQPLAPPATHHATEKKDVGIIDAAGVRSDPVELQQQLNADRIGDSIKLAPPITVQTEPMSNKCANNESCGSPNKGGAGLGGPDRKDEIVHDWRYYLYMSILTFVSAVLGAFSVHAFKYGLNEAWRDMVFAWPIPYWMRFVPKDEEGNF